MGNVDRFEVKENEDGLWWWRFVPANNEITAVSETYDGPNARSVAINMARHMNARMATHAQIHVLPVAGGVEVIYTPDAAGE